MPFLPHPFLSRLTAGALAWSILLSACQPQPPIQTAEPPAQAQPVAAPTTVPPSVGHAEWTRDATIYEVNVRQYTPEGTFRAFMPHLTRLRELGIEILWFMPIQPIGVENRKGTLGSYYSISDYTAVNPEFGTEADFRAVVDSAHALGMRVILDWVPNHTAFDHEWTRDHRDWYTLRPDGSISVARDNEGRETDWTDVADLNYDNQDMRRAMIGEMVWWLERMDIDGFRVDVAWGVPYDFWPQMRAALLAVEPELFLLAEAEDPKLHQWFDATYGWEFHHLLNEMAQGKKGTGALDEYFAKQRATYPPDAYRMYFTSNHDENSWQGTEFERMGKNHLPAFVLAATVEGSIPLLYTGQEASLSKRLRFFEKDTVDWKGTSLAEFYDRMFELKRSHPVLLNGDDGGTQRRVPTTPSASAFAFLRTNGPRSVLVAVNFGDQPARVAGIAASPGQIYRDWISGAALSGTDLSTIAIAPNGYRVLVR